MTRNGGTADSVPPRGSLLAWLEADDAEWGASQLTHAPAPTSPDLPLCYEADARARGWTTDELADTWPADDAPIARPGEWPTCSECLEWARA